MGTDTATPDATVIIPHYNDVTRLRRCLKSLMENDRTGVEILVVDNGSTQSLDEVRAEFPEIRFLTELEKVLLRRAILGCAKAARHFCSLLMPIAWPRLTGSPRHAKWPRWPI